MKAIRRAKPKGKRPVIYVDLNDLLKPYMQDDTVVEVFLGKIPKNSLKRILFTNNMSKRRKFTLMISRKNIYATMLENNDKSSTVFNEVKHGTFSFLTTTRSVVGRKEKNISNVQRYIYKLFTYIRNVEYRIQKVRKGGKSNKVVEDEFQQKPEKVPAYVSNYGTKADIEKWSSVDYLKYFSGLYQETYEERYVLDGNYGKSISRIKHQLIEVFHKAGKSNQDIFDYITWMMEVKSTQTSFIIALGHIVSASFINEYIAGKGSKGKKSDRRNRFLRKN